MKNLFYLILLSFAPIFLSAQNDGLHVVGPDANVGIGTDAPTEKLQVIGDTKTEGIIIEKIGGSGSVSCERVTRSAFAFGAGVNAGFTIDKNYHLEFRSNLRSEVLDRKISTGTLLMRFEKVTGDAGIGIGNPVTKLHVNGSFTYKGTINNASDKRLKRNINDFNYGLDEVLRLNPISYQYNGRGGIQNTDETHIGLFAQDLQRVAPDLVSSFTYEQEDKESNIISSEEYLMIEESSIKYMLVNAVKEQQAMIEDLQTEIAELKREQQADKGFNTNAENALGERAILKQNAPNPFSKITTVEYYLPQNTRTASIKVFNLVGRELQSFDLENTGNASIELDLSDLPNGMYLYSLIVDREIIDSKQMILE